MISERWLLTLMVFAPAAGAAVLLALPRGRDALVKWISLAVTAVPLLLSFQMLAQFNSSPEELRRLLASPEKGYQFVIDLSWIPAFNIRYLLGVDGISLPMVFLTALLSFLCIPASWGIREAVRGYFALFLLLETGMMGVFCALDFFLFYVFWEVMLLPMYFLIGIWGGPGGSTRRSSSSSTRCWAAS